MRDKARLSIEALELKVMLLFSIDNKGLSIVALEESMSSGLEIGVI